MIKNVAIVGPKSNEDVWNIPISFCNHFNKLGYNVKFYNTLINDKFDDTNLVNLIHEYKTNVFKPDLILHLDFGLFASKYLVKSNIPTAIWVVESGDDPQNFRLNYSKYKNKGFDLILSPDIRCVREYELNGMKAAWCPHFADPDQFIVEQEPIYDCVTTRSVEEPFFKTLKQKLQNRFVPRISGFFHGLEHSIHLKKGKIVIQNSKYKEITRRVFEGMMANRLVLTDRPSDGAEMNRIFEENKHIVYFNGIDECIEKVNFYCSNESERIRISNNGYLKVQKFHTTTARIQQILKLFV